jgi:hypothetical protein
MAATTETARFRAGPSAKVVAISQGGRGDQRATGALDGPRGQQPGLGGGQAAGQRGGREEQQPGHEYAAAAEQVPGPAAE